MAISVFNMANVLMISEWILINLEIEFGDENIVIRTT